MLVLMIILVFLLAWGIYFIGADILKIPYIQTSKAIVNTSRADKKLTNTIEACLLELAAKFSKYIFIDMHKRNRLKNVLKAADMRSSSYEAALTRLEARINSPELSDVVRGLIGVLRGDDEGMYFSMLAHDFKQLELRKLKGLAEKIPPKIKVFSFIMLMCFILTFLVVICIEVINSLGTIF